MRMAGGVVALLVALAGCGGGGETSRIDGVIPDASVQAPDATASGDASPSIDARSVGKCDNAVDLNDAANVTQDGDTLTYSGRILFGPGVFSPLTPECTEGTQNEVVHRLTLKNRSRVRATTAVKGNDFDSVMYLRTSCDAKEPSDEIDCNDDVTGETVLSVVSASDVPAGTTLYIVVDTFDGENLSLPLDYSLEVEIVPVLANGQDCDPFLNDGLCEPETACSIAGGSPKCEKPLGGPVVTRLSATLGQNERSLFIHFKAEDPDGDMQQVRVALLDGSGGEVASYLVRPKDEVTAMLAVETDVDLFGVEQDVLEQARTVRLIVEDSAQEEGSSEAPIGRPTWVGLGGQCGQADVECLGELTCEAESCAVPAQAMSACQAADATGTVGAGNHVVNITSETKDHLEGSCWFKRGLGEAVLRVLVPGERHVELVARTDVDPSPKGDDNLDTYLYLRTACSDPATELGCNDDALDDASSPDYRFASRLLLPDVAPGTYYLVIDGSDDGTGATATGTIGVSIEMKELKNQDERCDPTHVADKCEASLSCKGEPATCQPTT
ncbi:MAG: hypothetical protein HY698_19335 [Deltaproteobacteria bacterium]|nr:hypothetical protein [Deltaproteobacteria bacterium]